MFIINYKETITNDDGVKNKNFGTKNVAFNNKKDAIARIYNITDGIMNEFLDELDDECCYREANDSGDWQKVVVNNKTTDNDYYEYWISEIDIIEGENK